MTLPFKVFENITQFVKRSFYIFTSDIERVVDWINTGTAKKTTDDRGYDDDNCISRCGNEPKTSVEESLERGRILCITQLKPIKHLILETL